MRNIKMNEKTLNKFLYGATLASAFALSGCATIRGKKEKHAKLPVQVQAETKEEVKAAPAADDLQDVRGAGKKGTILEDKIFTAEERISSATASEGKEALFTLSDAQKSEYQSALGILGLQSGLLVEEKEASKEQIAELDQSVDYELMRKVSKEGSESLLLRARLNKDLGDLKRGHALQTADGVDYTVALTAEDAAKLGYEAPVEVKAELADATDGLKVVAPKFRTKFTESELAKLAKEKAQLDNDAFLDAAQDQKYAALATLVGTGKASEARAFAEKLHDLRLAADEKSAYVFAKDDKGKTQTLSAALAERGVENLLNSMRNAGDVLANKDFQALVAKSVEEAKARHAAEQKLGVSARNLEDNFYSIAELQNSVPEDFEGRESVLAALKDFASYSSRHPLLKKAMETEGAVYGIRRFTLNDGSRAEFFRFEVRKGEETLYKAEGRIGNGLGRGQPIHQLLDHLEKATEGKSSEKNKENKDEASY